MRAQFRKVFPNPKSPTDEFGKMRRPRAATTKLDLFKPKPDPVNARPAASVGLGGANRPDDVWSFKKALSAATGAGLDLSRDRSDDFGERLIDNLKGFQKAAGLKVPFETPAPQDEGHRQPRRADCEGAGGAVGGC